MSDPVIRLTDVGHTYGPVPVLSGVSFDVMPGELISVLGVSGSGKSTLLRAIAGFVTPTTGRIELRGDVVCADGHEKTSAQHRSLGMMFQDYALFPFMTVAENVAFGIHDKPDRVERVAELLEMVGLEGFEDRRPGTLSGGQQQRVALVRALAPRPVALLLDEPFANLDGSLRQSVGDEVRRILRRENTPGILVTHDRSEALGLADRVALLGPVEGREIAGLMQMGTPEEVYRSPTSREAAMLTGPAVFLPGEADGQTAHTSLGVVTLEEPVRGAVTVAIRPHQLTFTADGLGDCAVVDRQFLGPDYRVRVRSPVGEVWVDVGQSSLAQGSTGRLTVQGTCARLRS